MASMYRNATIIIALLWKEIQPIITGTKLSSVDETVIFPVWINSCTSDISEIIHLFPLAQRKLRDAGYIEKEIELSPNGLALRTDLRVA